LLTAKILCHLPKQGSRQRFSLPTAQISWWQRKAVGKDVLCRLPGRWQRKAGGKDGCLAGGKGKLVAKVGDTNGVPFATCQAVSRQR